MALADDITLNGDTYSSSTEGAKIYELVHRAAGGSLRRESTSAISNPKTLRVEHTDVVRNGVNRKRSLLRLDENYDDTDVGDVDMACYLVVDHPIKTDVTVANVHALLGRLIDLTQDTGLIDAIINGET